MNISHLRSETPGTDQVLHFNNAGSALPPAPVINVQKEYLLREAEMGGYEIAADREENLQKIYRSVATMLGANPAEIALMANATRAWDMAFYSLAQTFEPGDRILTSSSSYASNYLAFLQVQKRRGIVIEVIPPDTSGMVNVARLQNQLDNDVRLIALTHIPTNNGLVNPAEKVGEVARRANIPYLLDACQSAGQMPLSVEELGCTMLSATGRKFLRGPRGTGFLYVQDEWIQQLEPPLIDLHAATWTSTDSYKLRDDARRFESWEANMGARLGLGTAVEYAMDVGLDNIWKRIKMLSRKLRKCLSEMDAITVYDVGLLQSGIVTFANDVVSAEKIQAALRKQDINTSVSTPSSTLLDAEARGLPDLVRASVHYYNTEEEITRFISVLKDILQP